MLIMNYKKYAQILIKEENDSKSFEIFFDKFIKFLHTRDEIKILPDIFSEVEKISEQNKKNQKTKVILKNKSFLEKYKEEIDNFSDKFDVRNLKIEENKNIINGFILKNKRFKLDNSYKKRLLNLYNKILN